MFWCAILLRSLHIPIYSTFFRSNWGSSAGEGWCPIWTEWLTDPNGHEQCWACPVRARKWVSHRGQWCLGWRCILRFCGAHSTHSCFVAVLVGPWKSWNALVAQKSLIDSSGAQTCSPAVSSCNIFSRLCIYRSLQSLQCWRNGFHFYMCEVGLQVCHRSNQSRCLG